MVEPHLPARAPIVEIGGAGFAITGCLWILASTWPGHTVPAWPGLTCALLAIAFSLLPAPPLARAGALVGGLVGVGGNGVQIALLWGLAWQLS